jgi:endoglucanase
MDWVAAGDGTLRPSVAPADSSSAHEAMPVGSYDAIRVYLWLGIADRETPRLHALLGAVPGMAATLKGSVVPPLQVNASGNVLNPNGTIGFSAAVAPYLDALRMKPQAQAQMDRLVATKDATTGLYGRGAAYYDQSLALFALGWSNQQYRFERDGRLKVKWRSK